METLRIGVDMAFFADGKLKKIRAQGGPAEILCDANNGRGGSWGKDGTIVFSPAAEGPLYRVSAAGGTPATVTTLDSTKHETGHRWPCFLPDGKHFTYVVLPGEELNFDAYVASVQGGGREKLFLRWTGRCVFRGRGGYLVFRFRSHVNEASARPS